MFGEIILSYKDNYHFHGPSKAKLIGTEGRMVVVRDLGQKWKGEICCPGCVRFLLDQPWAVDRLPGLRLTLASSPSRAKLGEVAL